MLAIPVFRARVAPVLDWCSKILIFPEEGSDTTRETEINVTRENLFASIRTLREQGIKTLICGALSPEMLIYGQSIGLKIIHGIAGNIEDILAAYREQRLDQPEYCLPGCRGQRRYKGSSKCTGDVAVRNAPARNACRSGEGPGTATGGPGGFCKCPKCGSRKQHERGIPCSQMLCPACRISMIRTLP